jgi:hypothetical protein
MVTAHVQQRERRSKKYLREGKSGEDSYWGGPTQDTLALRVARVVQLGGIEFLGWVRQSLIAAPAQFLDACTSILSSTSTWPIPAGATGRSKADPWRANVRCRHPAAEPRQRRSQQAADVR